MSQTFETLKSILIDQYQVADPVVRPEASLADLGLDSLTMMEFVFAAEDAFGLRIPEERLGEDVSAITLQTICDTIDALKSPSP